MRLQNEGNNNPLVWTVIHDFESMKYLIEHYDTIDWLNYSFSVIEDKSQWSYPVYTMTIDDHINVRFVHVIETPSCEQPVRSGKGITNVDVRVKDVPAYIENCYLRRVERLLSNNIEPTFAISQGHFSEEELQALNDIESPYTKLFVLKAPVKTAKLDNFVITHGNEYDKSVQVWKCYTNRQKKDNKAVSKPVDSVALRRLANIPTRFSGARVANLFYK